MEEEVKAVGFLTGGGSKLVGVRREVGMERRMSAGQVGLGGKRGGEMRAGERWR